MFHYISLTIHNLIGAIIGTFTQQQHIVPADLADGDTYGIAAAIDGDLMIATAQNDDSGALTNNGAAYIYKTTDNGASWTQQQKLLGFATGDQMGRCCDLKGNIAAVGSVGIGVGGAVEMYKTSDGGATWTHKQTVVPSGTVAADLVGQKVALSGKFMVIGAPSVDVLGVTTGVAYVFKTTDDGETWTEKATLTDPSAAAGDYMGDSVAIHDNLIVVGTSREDDGVTLNTGAALVYKTTDDGETWTYKAKLISPSPVLNDNLGDVVAIYGNVIVAGSFQMDTAGGLYVYRSTDAGETWTQTAHLTPSDGVAGDLFAWDISMYGNVVAVGSREESTTATDSGAVYMYTTDDNGLTYTEHQKLKATTPIATQRFGAAVGISGNVVVAGAYSEESIGTTAFDGATYIFKY